MSNPYFEKLVAPAGSRQSEETRNLKPHQVTGVAGCALHTVVAMLTYAKVDMVDT
jgi:hypothetical protein